jgi:hypothetical protein
MDASPPATSVEQNPREPKRPYRTPHLEVFGPVAAITRTFNMSGTDRDGGPNNTKSF